MSVIVYHGTGKYNLEKLVADGPRLSPQAHLQYREAFSTTTAFKIASLFAIRRSPPAALTDEREVGVVMEYEITAKEGRGWKHAKCSGVLQDEKEIAVFNPGILEIRAVWRVQDGEWTRERIAQKAKR